MESTYQGNRPPDLPLFIFSTHSHLLIIYFRRVIFLLRAIGNPFRILFNRHTEAGWSQEIRQVAWLAAWLDGWRQGLFVLQRKALLSRNALSQIFYFLCNKFALGMGWLPCRESALLFLFPRLLLLEYIQLDYFAITYLDYYYYLNAIISRFVILCGLQIAQRVQEELRWRLAFKLNIK